MFMLSLPSFRILGHTKPGVGVPDLPKDAGESSVDNVDTLLHRNVSYSPDICRISGSMFSVSVSGRFYPPVPFRVPLVFDYKAEQSRTVLLN